MEEEKKKKRNKKKKSKQNNHTNNNKASEDDVSVGAATNNNSNGQNHGNVNDNQVIEVSSNGDVVDAEDFNGHYDKPNGAAPHSVRAQFFFSFLFLNFKTNLCARARLSND
jgi:hypothetical protein